MARTIIKLPLEIHLEIGDYISFTDLPKLVRACKFFARIHSRRLHNRRFSGAKLDAWFITDWRSEFAPDHVTAMADKLLPTNDPWSNSLLKSIEEADNELWLDIFIKRGMDINKKDDHGWSLLHFALEDGRDRVVNRLLDAGADVLSPAGGRFPTVGLPSHYLSRTTMDRLIATFKQAGEDISAPGPDGSRTALHYATHRGDHLTVKALIEHSAGVLAKNIDGYLPLLLAVRFRHYLTSEILLEAMARDPRGYGLNSPIPMLTNPSECLPSDRGMHQRPGGTILHLAVCIEDPQAVRLLLKYGADPQAEDDPIRVSIRPETQFTLAVKLMSPHLIDAFLSRPNPPRPVPARTGRGRCSNVSTDPGIWRGFPRVALPPLLSHSNPVYVGVNRALPRVFSMCKATILLAPPRY
ncbi:hypothetical protein ASPCAL14598 [Aspergillus calidoustus]|uniref:Uncharacterized protein n=1 Tax=Aspergillus calidoustus TaxID=454130 RepID=A0A0U5GKN3_ASPCI|nr:hypothetical protein ASPCAL14598 [Aspergillus calidoustus]